MLARSEPGTVVLLPLNVSLPLAPELERGAPATWNALRDALRQRGTDLKTLARSDARALWLDSIREARAAVPGAKLDFDHAARSFAQRIAKLSSFRTLVIPTLFLQSAEIQDGRARWDGVEREVVLIGRDDLPERVRLTEGVAPAASLHLAVFDETGEKVHEGQAGLDLLADVRVGKTGEFELVTRRNPLDDPQALREGVSRALAPFLPVRAEPVDVR